MTRALALRISGVALLAAAAAFGVHVVYGQGIAVRYVAAAYKVRPWVLAQPPYPPVIFWSAYATAAVRMVGFCLVYLLLRDRLPGRGPGGKGLSFGLLMLFCTDDFFRLPIMNVLVGNPLDVVGVQSAEGWVLYPLMGLVIAVGLGAGASPGRAAPLPQAPEPAEASA